MGFTAAVTSCKSHSVKGHELSPSSNQNWEISSIVIESELGEGLGGTKIGALEEH